MQRDFKPKYKNGLRHSTRFLYHRKMTQTSYSLYINASNIFFILSSLNTCFQKIKYYQYSNPTDMKANGNPKIQSLVFNLRIVSLFFFNNMSQNTWSSPEGRVSSVSQIRMFRGSGVFPSLYTFDQRKNDHFTFHIFFSLSLLGLVSQLWTSLT